MKFPKASDKVIIGTVDTESKATMIQEHADTLKHLDELEKRIKLVREVAQEQLDIIKNETWTL